LPGDCYPTPFADGCRYGGSSLPAFYETRQVLGQGSPVMIMPFGKYKGSNICDIPSDYLAWLTENARTLRPGQRQAIMQELDLRELDSIDFDAILTPARAAGWWSSMIRQWHREMALQFHPDRGGSVEAMKVINHAADRLKQIANDLTRAIEDCRDGSN
jgi:uncharacterized protein (DUF3820 family)